MEKEFKALKCLENLEECAEGMKDLPKSNWSDLAEDGAELDLKIMDWVETIEFELLKGKQALLELKSIKETNPSEALRKLDTIRHLEIGFDKNGKPITLNDTSGLNYIEKALTTKSKKEQAFDIIKKKRVDCDMIREYSWEAYCDTFNYWVRSRDRQLTKEEYDLLKEVLKND